jgi:hypothetical protein
MVQLGRLTGNLRTKLSSKNAINHRIAQAPPRRFPRRPTIHYFRRLKRSSISVCGPTVDQLRQDFWAAGACKCDTRKALDFPTLRFGTRGSEVQILSPRPLPPLLSCSCSHFQIARRFEFPSIPSNNDDFGRKFETQPAFSAISLRNATFDLILS